MFLEWSPVYWHPFLYQCYIRWAYGGHVGGRYASLAERVGDEESVVEVCCGVGTLYREYLKPRGIRYLGLDLNPVFVRAARRRKIPVRLFDLASEEVPPGDVVIMQGSLYQFLPDRARDVCWRLLQAARKRVFLCEPVRHLEGFSSDRFAARGLGGWLVRAGRGANPYRFGPEDFEELMKEMPGLSEFIEVGGGRDRLAVFEVGPERTKQKGCHRTL